MPDLIAHTHLSALVVFAICGTLVFVGAIYHAYKQHLGRAVVLAATAVAMLSCAYWLHAAENYTVYRRADTLFYSFLILAVATVICVDAAREDVDPVKILSFRLFDYLTTGCASFTMAMYCAAALVGTPGYNLYVYGQWACLTLGFGGALILVLPAWYGSVVHISEPPKKGVVSYLLTWIPPLHATSEEERRDL